MSAWTCLVSVCGKAGGPLQHADLEAGFGAGLAQRQPSRISGPCVPPVAPEVGFLHTSSTNLVQQILLSALTPTRLALACQQHSSAQGPSLRRGVCVCVTVCMWGAQYVPFLLDPFVHPSVILFERVLNNPEHFDNESWSTLRRSRVRLCQRPMLVRLSTRWR